MMLLNLACCDCIKEQLDNGVPNKKAGQPILTPYEPVNNDGIYIVKCSKGHRPIGIINNIDFEILFEYAINAIIDGYYREAVSSFASSIERYFEFFIKVSMKASGSSFNQIDKFWKLISNQSERQLGAYILAFNQMFNENPTLLNTNKEVPFRNSVIHKGYIPNKDETIEFGNKCLQVIEGSLLRLKTLQPEMTKSTFEYYGYENKANATVEKDKNLKGKNLLSVNILTTIDVIHGRDLNESDNRKGDIQRQIDRIKSERTPTKLTLKQSK